MRLLVLGGTTFVGRHFAELALRRGHSVTLFTRGRTGPNVLPECPRIVGDRKGDLSGLSDGSWDAVLDTSGYRPDDVRRSARRLKEACNLYAFVSTLNVYPDHSSPGLTEDMATYADEDGNASVANDPYGMRKAQCEREVQRAFGERALIIRPGLIVGPHDNTDRFGYWPTRFALGGDVLIPGPPEAPLQVVDARDHAAFVLKQIERHKTGVYNVTSPPGRSTMADLASACRHATGAGTPVWIDPQHLASYGIQPWNEIPLWFGDDDRRWDGTMQVCTRRAEAAGLRCRSLVATVADVLAWEQSRGTLSRRGQQLSALRERMLLLIARDEGWIIA